MRLNKGFHCYTLLDTLRHCFAFAVCFAGLYAAKAQNLTQDWSKTFPNTGEKAFSAMIEATNGYLVAVGESKSDGFLLITDHSTGQIVTEARFGGSKDDAFRAVAQTFDGHFLLAGTTASKGQGGTDAWLVEVDERGRTIREAVFGTPGRDECREMLLLPDGSVLLAGYKDGQKDGDVWLLKAVLKPAPPAVATNEKGKAPYPPPHPFSGGLVWTTLCEKTLGTNEFETLSGLVAGSDGGAVFCGNTGRKAEKG